MKHSYWIFALVPLLSGCNQSTSPLATAAAQATASQSPVITPGNMPGYCLRQVSSQFAAKPNSIRTGVLIASPQGYFIQGVADLGAQGGKAFKCHFDGTGHFTSLKSLRAQS